ncbi:hypothetical protein AO391_24895 [Pseudomonas marginalis ICMP 9505]|nr:hypothetical protein AO391_24895 [Pseudomonas marginalis ICMP 9505]
MFLQLAEPFLNQHFFIWVNTNPKTDEDQTPPTGTVLSQMFLQLAEPLLNQHFFIWVNTNAKNDEDQTVGGGLLPMAVWQCQMRRLKDCYREQAPSHIWSACIQRKSYSGATLGNRARKFRPLTFRSDPSAGTMRVLFWQAPPQALKNDQNAVLPHR